MRHPLSQFPGGRAAQSRYQFRYVGGYYRLRTPEGLRITFRPTDTVTQHRPHVVFSNWPPKP